MYERKDVWTLTKEDEWHPILEWYARAVGAMKKRAESDPTSWTYMAAIHGATESPAKWPSGATWNQCQHQSWFFLPWHRIYLYYFERVVRQAVVDLGGPSDWALPYWDYTDPTRSYARVLPPAFRQETMPSGDPNPLYTKDRYATINAGDPLPLRDVDVSKALNEAVFTIPGGMLPGFGGPMTSFHHGGGPSGALEQSPHNLVHVDIGGLMSRVVTAGLDAIFWLHHANIDRLWEVWLNQPHRRNPTDASWNRMKFNLGQGSSAVFLAVQQVLDPTRAPLSYRYTNTTRPQPTATPPVSAFSLSANTMETRGPEHDDDFFPEMVGANEGRVALSTSRVAVDVPVGAPTGPAMMALSASEKPIPRKVYLKIENVKASTTPTSSYSVYVNLPDEAEPEQHEDRYAGQMPMFGVIEATVGDEEHSGSGVSFAFDITDIAELLHEAEAWTPDRLRVTFVPARREDEQEGDLTAGRISVFYA